MDFFEFISGLKKINSSLILYSLLNRIPIIIIGDESEDVDDFAIDLSELMHFRKDLVYYTDFVTAEEYDQLIQNENIDYNTQRTQIRCPCSVSGKALLEFNRFYSWIIGFKITDQKKRIATLRGFIVKKIPIFLEILLFSKSVSIRFEGLNVKTIDLIFEQNVLHKISQDTEKSVIKMKRVLSENIKSQKLDKDLISNLLDFEVEKQELKKNILKSEIQNFFSGSKRAFFILSRMHLLNGFEIKAKIGNRTLLETIDYEDASIERIISFIQREWGENFSDLFENGKKANILDSMQSLWG